MALAVCTDVGTTTRTRLTKGQKTELYEAQGGLCPLCARRMERGEKLRDEHLRALGLGGTNDLGNRAIVHAECAYTKTFGADGDLAAINKAKAVKAASLGFNAPKRPIPSAPMPKAAPQRSARLPDKADALPPLPRRLLFIPAA